MRKFNNNEVGSLFKARSPNLTKAELKSAVKNYRDIINQQNFVYDKKRLYALKDGMNRMHGANAEANSHAYIQNKLGHSMKPTDFNKSDMFNLDSLSPFADETLQPVTKKSI